MKKYSRTVLYFFVNLYQALPLSGITKFRIRTFIFLYFGFICKSLPAYTQFKQIYGNKYPARNKVALKRKDTHVLMIYASLPMPDKDAGSIFIDNVIKIMIELGYCVSFFPLYFRNHIPQYTDYYRGIGINVIDDSIAGNLSSYLNKEGHNYSYIYLVRYDIGNECYKTIQKYASHCKIIFYNLELAYLREKRQAEITNSFVLQSKASRTKKIELDFIEKADYTFVHTGFEKRKILSELENGSGKSADLAEKIKVFPYICDIDIGNPPENREGIMFIGNYAHPPNYDAALYFLKDILPRIREKQSDMKCYIVGSNPPEELYAYQTENTVITGYVEEAKDYFKRVKLTIVPLRFSSSVRGKVIISLGHGTPCVATSIGVEGMGLTHGQDIFVADDIDSFAHYVTDVYQNQELWKKVSDRGLQFVQQNHSYGTGKKIISAIIK